MFLQGLTPQSLRTACLTNGPHTLQEAIDVATRLEPLFGFATYPYRRKYDRPQARGSKSVEENQKPNNKQDNSGARSAPSSTWKPHTSIPSAPTCTLGGGSQPRLVNFAEEAG